MAPSRTAAGGTGHLISNAGVANTTISARTRPNPAPKAAPRSAPTPRRLVSSLIGRQSTLQQRSFPVTGSNPAYLDVAQGCTRSWGHDMQIPPNGVTTMPGPRAWFTAPAYVHSAAAPVGGS